MQRFCDCCFVTAEKLTDLERHHRASIAEQLKFESLKVGEAIKVESLKIGEGMNKAA